MNWDAEFQNRADPSGRSAGVHSAAYDASFKADSKNALNGEPASKKAKI